MNISAAPLFLLSPYQPTILWTWAPETHLPHGPSFLPPALAQLTMAPATVRPCVLALSYVRRLQQQATKEHLGHLKMK